MLVKIILIYKLILINIKVLNNKLLTLIKIITRIKLFKFSKMKLKAMKVLFYKIKIFFKLVSLILTI